MRSTFCVKIQETTTGTDRVVLGKDVLTFFLKTQAFFPETQNKQLITEIGLDVVS